MGPPLFCRCFLQFPGFLISDEGSRVVIQACLSYLYLDDPEQVSLPRLACSFDFAQASGKDDLRRPQDGR